MNSLITYNFLRWRKELFVFNWKVNLVYWEFARMICKVKKLIILSCNQNTPTT